MTWLAPIPMIPETSAETARFWPVAAPAQPLSLPSGEPSRAMASASAGPAWRWISASPAATRAEIAPLSPPVKPGHVRIPVDLIRRMSLEARLSGKSESEVWAEAARAWLSRRERDDDLPPTPPAAAQPCPRRERTAWVAIDALLIDLRARSCEPTAA